MIPPISQTGGPSAEQVGSAYDVILQYGAVGAMLVIIMGLFILVGWKMINTFEKDKATLRLQAAEREKSLVGINNQLISELKQLREETIPREMRAVVDRANELIEQAAAQWRERFDNYQVVLREKDALITTQFNQMMDITSASVKASTTLTQRLDQVLDIILDNRHGDGATDGG